MSIQVANISLRIWHPSMRASDIALEFGLTPRFSRTVGDPRPPSSDGGLYDETYVSMQLVRKASVELDEELRRWCDVLSAKARFLDEIVGGGGKAEFYVSLFTEALGGFELDHSLLKRIVELSLGVSVEIYPPVVG